MVEGDHVPGVVEHGRPGRALFGIGRVMREPVGARLLVREVDQAVVADHHLLHLAVRVLDDVDRVADEDLSLFLDERRVAERAQTGSAVGILDRDQREIEIAVAQEKAVGVELKTLDGLLLPGATELEVELDGSAGRTLRLPQDVVVGQEKHRRHQETGGVGRPPVPDADRDPADAAAREHAALQERGGEEVARFADDALRENRVQTLFGVFFACRHPLELGAELPRDGEAGSPYLLGEVLRVLAHPVRSVGLSDHASLDRFESPLAVALLGAPSLARLDGLFQKLVELKELRVDEGHRNLPREGDGTTMTRVSWLGKRR